MNTYLCFFERNWSKSFPQKTNYFLEWPAWRKDQQTRTRKHLRWFSDSCRTLLQVFANLSTYLTTCSVLRVLQTHIATQMRQMLKQVLSSQGGLQNSGKCFATQAGKVGKNTVRFRIASSSRFWYEINRL